MIITRFKNIKTQEITYIPQNTIPEPIGGEYKKTIFDLEIIRDRINLISAVEIDTLNELNSTIGLEPNTKISFAETIVEIGVENTTQPTNFIFASEFKISLESPERLSIASPMAFNPPNNPPQTSKYKNIGNILNNWEKSIQIIRKYHDTFLILFSL